MPELNNRSTGVFIAQVFPALLTWVLFGLTLGEVLPAAWMIGAFPAALLVGWLLVRFKVRVLPGLILIGLLPWIVRGLVLLAAVASKKDFQLAWDRAWLLSAPLWYLIAIGRYFTRRFPVYGYYECLLFVLGGALLIGPALESMEALSVPQKQTLSLFIAFGLLLAAIWAFHVLFNRLRGGRAASTKRPGQGLYIFLFGVFLIVLVFLGIRVRKEEALSSGGGVLSSDLFRFDFGDVLSLEPQIELNAELTMLYREDGTPQTRYLRRFTLSGWSEERGFYRESEMELDFPGAEPLPSVLPRAPKTLRAFENEYSRRIEQEYYLVALDPESFFALRSPVRVEPWTIWDDASFVQAYAVESMVSDAGPWELYDAPPDNLPEEYRNFLLQGGDEVWYRETALEIVEGKQGTWSRATAIEDWLQENFYYSLNPGLAPDGDQLSWFLTESRKGYCSYFAFAMTRLCRSIDIPARIAVGFFTDPNSSVLGFVPVRSDQAHAWVEVWVEDYGWITFDPTTDRLAPDEDYPIQFIAPDEWLPLVEEVLTRRGEVSVALDDALEDSEESTTLWRDVLIAFRDRPGLYWILFLLAAAVLYLPHRWIPDFIDLLDRRSKDPRRNAKGRWRRVSRCLVRGGYLPETNETASEWSKRICDSGLVGFDDLTRIYLKAEFSESFDTVDSDVAKVHEKTVRESWSRQALALRIKAFFNPGWRVRLP